MSPHSKADGAWYWVPWVWPFGTQARVRYVQCVRAVLVFLLFAWSLGPALQAAGLAQPPNPSSSSHNTAHPAAPSSTPTRTPLFQLHLQFSTRPYPHAAAAAREEVSGRTRDDVGDEGGGALLARGGDDLHRLLQHLRQAGARLPQGALQVRGRQPRAGPFLRRQVDWRRPEEAQWVPRPCPRPPPDPVRARQPWLYLLDPTILCDLRGSCVMYPGLRVRIWLLDRYFKFDLWLGRNHGQIITFWEFGEGANDEQPNQYCDPFCLNCMAQFENIELMKCHHCVK